MKDEDIIGAVRSMRKLVSTMDSLGFPTKQLLQDEELAEFIEKDLPIRISKISSEIHDTLQSVEKSKRYREVIKRLCDIKERK